MAVLYTNNAASTLSASISLSATSFSVASGQGALFPAISGSDFFYVTLVDSASNIEIVKVTARSTDTFTVVRGQDGTLARAWSANDKVELRITKAMLDQVKVDALQSVTNLAFTGTGNRVTGDFSNATVASRVLFQTSTANGNTFLSLAPNGTAVNSQFQAYNSSDTANASIAALVASATQVRIVSGFIGSGTLNPITFIFSSTEAARFDPTTRNFLIGSSTDNVTDKLQVTGSANITGALKENGNQTLNASNYSNYALPITGGALSGNLTLSSGYIDLGGHLYGRSDTHVMNTAGNGWTRIIARNGGSPYLENITYGGNTMLHYGNLVARGQWTPITSGGVTRTGLNSWAKTGGTNNNDAQVYSAESYVTNVYCQATFPNVVNANTYFGLNSIEGNANDTAAGYTGIDYLWYCSLNQLYIWESGTYIGTYGTATASTILTIAYDGTNVRYYKDGVLQRTVARAVGAALYFDSNFYENGGVSQLANVEFGRLPQHALLRSGGTMDGPLVIASGMTAWNTTTPGTGVGNFHIGTASATGSSGGAITFGARDSGSGGNAQAGIYVTSDGSFGTRMYLATTDSYASCAKVALSINEIGNVNITRGALTQGGNQVLHAGNYTSYSPSLTGSGASGTWGINITGYGYGTNTLDTDRSLANRLPTSTPQSVRFDFASASAVGTGGNYAGVMTFSPWTGTTASTGDASYQLAFGSTAAAGGGDPRLRLRKGIDSTWNAWVDVLTSANISSYAAPISHTHSYLPLSGGTLSGNLLFANATSPNTYYIQFGDNSGWKLRYMTSVSGTPTERFGFTDTGNFSAVGSVTWGTSLNNGNPRSLAIGYSGGNYGQAGYGVTFTATSSVHNYALNDVVSLWEAYDGLRVYAAAAGTVGTAINWTTVLDARRSNTSMLFNGKTVLDSSNYTNYVAGLGGGNYTGTLQVTQTGVVDAFKSVNTSTTLTDESSIRFQKTMTPTGTATTNSLGGMEWEGKNSNGTSYEMARIYATNITSTSLDSGNYAVGELHLASYRYIGGYSESVRMRLSGGNIYWHFSGTERLRQDSAKIYPSTSGAYNLGDASFKFGTVHTNSITFGDGTTQSTGIPTTYTISYLVVAGGGGGGNSGNSGGGGGGGVLAANVSLAVGTTYSVTVGAGGAVNAVGGSSSFGLFATANGGGAGGAANAPGGNGGSGGGGGFMNAAQAGGSGTAGQGYAGGASTTAYGGGGGGGAGAVGNAGTGNGGNGGTGFTSSITGTTTVYGGGGGGGSNAGQGLGGSGGGGNGGPGTSTAGAVNTGGGGGGFGNTTVGRGGGSGVVILQIPTSNYTGLTTGSPTVTTSGSYTILKFTSSGSYTA